MLAWILFVDQSDLLTFIQIALSMAEDDLSRDKLSNLRSVGNGFSAIIYKLPRTVGYKELERRFKRIWENIDHDQKLPTLLVFMHQ